MKRILISVLFVLMIVSSQAQTATSSTLAPFDITLVNDLPFKAFQLKKNQPVILMYFSPECDHCKDLTKSILQKISAIKDKQLLMITYYPVPEVKKFSNDFALQKYPNVKVGTEGMKLIVQKHYNIRKFPFIVLYDKSGRQVKMFREQVPATEIVKAMQDL